MNTIVRQRMPADTRRKRAAAIGLGRIAPTPLTPDGTIDASDRTAVLGGYPLSDTAYTRGDENVLPADDTSLETEFSSGDYTTVSTDDGNRVNQSALEEYAIFLFKDKHTQEEQIHVSWNGQSDLAPSSSTIYLQIYNRDSTTWETIASNSAAAADTDFDLEASVSVNLSNYFDVDFWVACRVYQEAA